MSATHPFDSMLEQQVQVITMDGRVFIGILKGVDQALNCVLEESEERAFSKEKGVQKLPFGLQLIRGDTVAMLGEVDQQVDALLNFKEIKVDPLPSITN